MPFELILSKWNDAVVLGIRRRPMGGTSGYVDKGFLVMGSAIPPLLIMSLTFSTPNWQAV